MHTEKIFTISISTGLYTDFVKQIVDLTDDAFSSYVCFANVHMTMEAYHDPDFSKVVNNADIVTPDGRPLSLFLKLFKGIQQDRICGMDLFPDILREAEKRGKSVYFYGNTPEVLEKIVGRIRMDFPSLAVAGTCSPPFRTLSLSEKDDVIREIGDAAPDLIFVSLGCPRQENWMAEHKGKFRGCMLGLGQAFNVFARLESRSPRWMQKYALDWLYRLYLNPGRLWKRYIVTNSQFLYLTLRHSLSRKQKISAVEELPGT